jgi:hypothetical protein
VRIKLVLNLLETSKTDNFLIFFAQAKPILITSFSIRHFAMETLATFYLHLCLLLLRHIYLYVTKIYIEGTAIGKDEPLYIS